MRRTIGLLTALACFFSFSPVIFADSHEEPPLQELEQKFQQLIEVETEESSWKVSEYESAQAMEEDFYRIMSEPLADVYLKQYFKKEDGDYYLLPQDGPPYIDFDQAYTLEEKDDNHYQLTQEKSPNQLREAFTLTIDYVYRNDQWIIADRNNRVPAEGDELADTATAYPLWTFLGIMLIGVAFLLLKRSTASAQ